MNRRNLIICLCTVLVLVVANVVAIVFLYVPKSDEKLPEDVQDSLCITENQIDTTKAEVKDSVAVPVPAEPADTVAVTVEVPQGPFEVKNCATGLKNRISQNADNSLTLRDNKGVPQWTMPFSGKLCGRVQTIDYFANGKLQFLCISGRQLYLIDRLGRIVGGFPVTLAKDVLFGPDTYDFSGARRYNIIVLNTDNTIDMYNLKGVRPEEWKTITAPSTIIGLPEYVDHAGKSFWIVRTSTQSLVYSFYGDLVKTFDGEANMTELY